MQYSLTAGAHQAPPGTCQMPCTVGTKRSTAPLPQMRAPKVSATTSTSFPKLIQWSAHHSAGPGCHLLHSPTHTAAVPSQWRPVPNQQSSNLIIEQALP
eukprot:6457582-Amphidinium_carterae.1